MYQTVLSLKPLLEKILSEAEIRSSNDAPAIQPTAHFMRKGGNEPARPYVVFSPQPSPISQDSVSDYDDDTFEIHSVSGDPDEAVKMLDALVEGLRALRFDTVVISGGKLIGCTCIDTRDVQDATVEGGPDTYDAATVWRFRIEKVRRQ